MRTITRILAAALDTAGLAAAAVVVVPRRSPPLIAAVDASDLSRVVPPAPVDEEPLLFLASPPRPVPARVVYRRPAPKPTAAPVAEAPKVPVCTGWRELSSGPVGARVRVCE